MTTFLTTIAERHFEEHPRQSLLAGLAARMDGRNLVQALATGCRPLQHLAWLKLTKWDEADISAQVVRTLNDDGPELPAVLKAISHESIPVSDAILERVASLMESARSEVRLAAARVVAFKSPLAAIPLLRSGRSIDVAVLRTLCLADEPSLVMPLLVAFGFPQKSPPPTIGFLVTPEWLADNHAREPLAVEWLIRHCGYCEDGLCDAREVGEAVSREMLNLLSSGFSFVTSRMTNEPRMTKVAHRWQRRIRAFVWRMLPEELSLERDDTKPLDASDPFEIELFLAAVRDVDRSLFLEQKSRPPFDRIGAGREPTPVCFHAATRYVRRLFVDEPMQQADQWGIGAEHRGDFLIDAARVRLEPNDEARTATELARRGRWLASRTDSVCQSLRELNRSMETQDDDNRLSPGADSVTKLAAACSLNRTSIADWLANAEANWSRCLVPMGIELQIPKVEADQFTLIKESLQRLGIPSPNRSEFGGMVEASFRPARSFHAMILGPLLLARWGVISEPQDMALHISLQGQLDERVRFIAFPQLFIHPSQRLRNRPDWSMARVMSKGFVHVHSDAEWLPTPGSSGLDVATEREPRPHRTELRLVRVFAEETDRGIQIAPGFISDVIAVQVLGSALLSDCPRCQALFGEYAKGVEGVVCEMPVEFQQLLNSNYFESTGDPRDEALLNLLPIFRRWSSVRQIVRERDLSSKLDEQFRRIRHRSVSQLLSHFSGQHDLDASGITVTDDSIHLSLPGAIDAAG